MWAKNHSTFRHHGASYPRWIVRSVVRNNGIIFVWPSPEWLLYDRLVATAKVLQEKCCGKDGEEDTDDDDYSDLYINKSLNMCISPFKLRSSNSPVDRWTVIVDRRSNISIVLVDNREDF